MLKKFSTINTVRVIAFLTAGSLALLIVDASAAVTANTLVNTVK